MGPSSYIWVGIEQTPLRKLEAVRHRMPLAAAFSGLTAAWLHGLDVEPCDPIEVTVPTGTGVSSRAGIALRRSALETGDVTNVRGMPTTSLVHALADVCGRMDLVEAVVIADMALHLKLVRLEQLRAWAMDHGRHRGISKFRRLITLAEPAAESPMESRLRMLLVLNRLPRPQAQVPIHDQLGQFVGRPDLYYKDCRLAIEYDGGVHRESMTEDNRRQNRLVGAGIRLLRFTAGDLFNHPESVVEQVRTQISPNAGKVTIRVLAKRPNAGKSAEYRGVR